MHGKTSNVCDLFQDVKGFSMLLFHSLGHGDSGRWLTVTGLSLFFFVYTHTVYTEQSYLSTILFPICNVHVYKKSYTTYGT